MPVVTQPVVYYPVTLLDIGDSFFVPSLTVGIHIHKMRKLAAEVGYTIDYQTGVDVTTGLYGIRVIRTA